MPRFYFHVSNGSGFVEDEFGEELRDLDAAHRKAILAARGMMSDELREGRLDLASFIEIEDESHQLVLTVFFQDAVEVNTTPKPRRR